MHSYQPKKHHRRSIRLKGYDYSQKGLYFITICCQNRICRFGDVVDGEMALNEYGQIAYNEWLKLSDRFSNFELDVFQIMPNHMHGIILLNNVSVVGAAVGAVGAGFTPAQIDLNTQNELDIKNNLDAQNGGQYDDDITTARVVRAVNDINIKNNLDAQNVGQYDDNIRATARVVRAVNDINIKNDLDVQNVGQYDDNIRATARVAPTVYDIVGAYKSLVANGCLEIWKSKWAGVTPVPIMGKLWQRNYYEHIIRNEQSYQMISNYIINNPAKWTNDKFYNQ